MSARKEASLARYLQRLLHYALRIEAIKDLRYLAGQVVVLEPHGQTIARVNRHAISAARSFCAQGSLLVLLALRHENFIAGLNSQGLSARGVFLVLPFQGFHSSNLLRTVRLSALSSKRVPLSRFRPAVISAPPATPPQNFMIDAVENEKHWR